MGIGAMKFNYRGLLKEKHRNGASRWRVRVEGKANIKIDIHVAPDHPQFSERYHAARAGKAPDPVFNPIVSLPKSSLGRLRIAYMEYFERQVKAGQASPKTLKKKRNLLSRLIEYDKHPVDVPDHQILKWRDSMLETPAQADAFISALRLMFKWGIKRNLAKHDPTANIDRIYKKGNGATPWTASDVRKYFEYHKPGTKQHAALSLLMWTGCRIEDLLYLGRSSECIIDGVEALSFKPHKKNSTLVELPFLDPLKRSVRALKVEGSVYVLGKKGMPFASGDSISATFIHWCKLAGLENRSAHGVRKGLAELLAESGCSQYQIMAILGHSEAKTSEVYTRRADRWKLAKQAISLLKVGEMW